MTDRVLYQKIVDVLATLDRDSYPEIACTLDGAISEDGEVFYEAYDLADELCALLKCHDRLSAESNACAGYHRISCKR